MGIGSANVAFSLIDQAHIQSDPLSKLLPERLNTLLIRHANLFEIASSKLGAISTIIS